MRTTLTLDPDVAERLKDEATRSDHAFKQVVNEALRRGLQLPAESAQRTAYRVKPLTLVFRPGVDPDRLNQLADELENEALVRKQRT
jgi:hypothetical protein